MTDKEYDGFMIKCTNIPYKDYSWLKDHCYSTLKRPCSPNARNEHLAILDLIKEHEERQWIPVSKRLPEESGNYWCTFGGSYLTGKDYYTTESDAKEIFDEPEEYTGWQSQNVIAWMPLPKPYEPKESEDKDE